MIAVEQRHAVADGMHGAMREAGRRDGFRPRARGRAVMGDLAERKDGARGAASPRSSPTGTAGRCVISAGVGLFSGGTQRTALVIAASISVSPSSGRAS